MSEKSRRNGLTVLVVYDTEIVRDFLVVILKRANFNVISADSGPNALALAAKTKGKIDLLLTDWDMPEMSGIALGQRLKLLRPEIRVMQVSAGAHDTMMVLNYGWAFLQKPVVAERLIQMVNDVLHTTDRSQIGGESFDSRIDTNPNSPQAKDPDNHPADSNEPEDRGR